MNKGGQNNLARSRWSLLQKAIIQDKRIPDPKDNPASKRVFEKFSDIISWTSDSETGKVVVEVKVEKDEKENNNKFASNKLNINASAAAEGIYKLTVFRSKKSDVVDIDDLRGYDKTGRICIWPAEQVLTYWCLKYGHIFEGKSVIEIGGGFHCLAGLAIAKFIKAREVVLTDGDPTNLQQIVKSLDVEEGNGNFSTKSVRGSLLHWNGYSHPEFNGKFDFVIAADVVYDSCVFESLIKTVAKLLTPNGKFILFNPTRVAQLVELIKLAEKSELYRDIKVSEDFDANLSSIVESLKKSDHNFNKDWHYPHQVVFSK